MKNTTLLNFVLACACFLLLTESALAQSENPPSEPSRLNFTLGVGPNFGRFDAVNDDLKSDVGFSIWGDYSFSEHWFASLAYDDLKFGSPITMQGLLLGVGYHLNPESFYNPYLMLGAGVGNAKNFPNSTPSQTPTTIQLKGGLDVLAIGALKLGLAVEYLNVDLDDNLAKTAQITTPFITLSYRPSNEKEKSTPAPVVAEEGPKDSDGDGIYDDKDLCPNTPPNTKVNSYGCKNKETVTVNLMVNFPTNSSVIPEAEFNKLQDFATMMIKHPEITDITIEGHTDSVGKESYNQKLSERRASSVRSHLVKFNGISESRIKSVGYGPSRPIDSNETVEGRFKNRRVVGTFKAKD